MTKYVLFARIKCPNTHPEHAHSIFTRSMQSSQACLSDWSSKSWFQLSEYGCIAYSMKYSIKCRKCSSSGPRAATHFLACMAGKPCQPISLVAQQAFHCTANMGQDPTSIGKSSRKKYYFRACCGQHLVLHSARYVHECLAAALSCRLCSCPQPLSSHEACAWKTVHHVLQNSNIIWLVEATVGSPGMRPADI